MNSFDIVSDGSCDLTKEQINELGIKIIPFYVSLDGVKYEKEIEELSLETFYGKMLAENLFPKTSLPSVHDYIDIFEESLKNGRDVICFTITDTLSGSFHSAMNAKHILEETYTERKIHIVNSHQATGSLALLLREISKMRSSGLDIDTVYEKAMSLRDMGGVMFMVGSLDHLQNGGRIGKMTFVAGSLFNLKPIIDFRNGEVHSGGVVRSRKKGLKKLVDKTLSHFEQSGEDYHDYSFVIGTTNNWDEVPEFELYLKEAFPDGDFFSPFQIGATISTHTGPHTTGICFIKKYDKM